jgi:hypothetical protein
MGKTLKGSRIPAAPDGRLGVPHRQTKIHHMVGLSCGHVLMFYKTTHCPQIDERAWCFRCEAYAVVTVSPNGALVVQHYARCRSCQASRRTGANRAEAERFADGHAFRSGHTVDVFPDETQLEPVSTFRPQSDQLDLGELAM